MERAAYSRESRRPERWNRRPRHNSAAKLEAARRLTRQRKKKGGVTTERKVSGEGRRQRDVHQGSRGKDDFTTKRRRGKFAVNAGDAKIRVYLKAARLHGTRRLRTRKVLARQPRSSIVRIVLLLFWTSGPGHVQRPFHHCRSLPFLGISLPCSRSYRCHAQTDNVEGGLP